MASTPEHLVVGAERLFADAGFEGVSLRQISAAAGQGNNYAVQYHFGGKAGLIEAIVEYRLARVDARRLALLAAAEAKGHATDLRSLLEAFLIPLAEELK